MVKTVFSLFFLKLIHMCGILIKFFCSFLGISDRVFSLVMRINAYSSMLRLRQPIVDFFAQFPISLFPSKSILHNYSVSEFQHDWKAGLNVAALAFAQGMACSLIAGLPIQYGIYGAIIAPIIGGLFTGSKNTVLGPTNATAILLLSGFMALPAGVDRLSNVCLMVFLIGIFQIIGAFLQIASLTRFISRSVIVGYVSAASVLIAMNQFHHILGFPLREATTFFNIAKMTLTDIDQTTIPALMVSAFTGGTYMAVRNRFQKIPAAATALVLASLFAFFLTQQGFVLKCLSSVSLTEFKFHLPAFSSTGINAVLSSAVACAFLSMLENTFMAKSLGNKTGQRVDVHQEFYGLGMANVACSLTGGMVASGSVTRSGLNWKSGAATFMSGLYSGVICLIAFAFLGDFIGYIPVCSLATLVMIVALNVIDFHSIRTCFRSTKSDATVLMITFIVALISPLSFAIFMGVSTSVVLFLRKASMPKLAEYHFDEGGVLREIRGEEVRDHPQISIIHVEGDLFFGASDIFRDEISHVCRDPFLKVVIIRLKNARHIDASSVMALEDLLQFLNKSHRFMIVSGVNRETYNVFRRSGLLFKIGVDHVIREISENPTLATKIGLQRAVELVGGQKPVIRIFGDSAFERENIFSYEI